MTSLANIFTGLRAALAARQTRDAAFNALILVVWTRLARVKQRLERLIAHWRAGTVPKPRPPSPARPARPAHPGKPAERPKLPGARGWVSALGSELRGPVAQLNHLFTTDAEFARFLREVPQAGRILRPLCHLLGIEPPAPLRRQPRPRPTRPKPPPRPKPAPFRVPIPKGLRLWRRRRFSSA